jgi:hypothetical protein
MGMVGGVGAVQVQRLWGGVGMAGGVGTVVGMIQRFLPARGLVGGVGTADGVGTDQDHQWSATTV